MNDLLTAAGLTVFADEPAAGAQPGWRRLTCSFDWLDQRGTASVGKAHIYLSPTFHSSRQVPLLFCAGYQLNGGVHAFSLPRWTTRDIVIVNPTTPEPGTAWPLDNALGRGQNLDAALLHRVRSLPCIDDEHVVITGVSAGGYMTLLLAGETFPLAGAIPDVAPVNWAYNAAYMLAMPGSAADGTAPPAKMISTLMTSILGDVDGQCFYDHSPVAHLDTITAPVAAAWSTADMLVPIDQVSAALAQPRGEGFADGFTTDPLALVKNPNAQVPLVDRLASVEIHTRTAPEGTTEIRQGTPIPPDAWGWIDMPAGASQWTITVIDEGPSEPWVDHLKYSSLFDQSAFLDRVLSRPIDAEQLTATKLERLMDRYAGIEWLGHALLHLDSPDAERADVLRGLRTYAADPARAVRLEALYRALTPERQVLGPVEGLLDRL